MDVVSVVLVAFMERIVDIDYRSFFGLQVGVRILVSPQPTGIAFAPVKAKIASNKRIQRDDMKMVDNNREQKRRAMISFLGCELEFTLLY